MGSYGVMLFHCINMLFGEFQLDFLLKPLRALRSLRLLGPSKYGYLCVLCEHELKANLIGASSAAQPEMAPLSPS